MTRIRPKFDAPPVVETVLSVQFSSLPGFATAHAGWFWKEYLEKLTEDVPPLATISPSSKSRMVILCPERLAWFYDASWCGKNE
ncbi:MAG: hypothetical protein DMG41_37135 [Acidobacteria bacterium]|nr:MAG: hypothetical protein AUH13_15285 [Acidobacteria bacterium 13_2_20CM_58_27]PYT72245.1 MAG: hypothetical protein DMG42_14755 [Acidobacteriota bacterium]PYT80386.1 MAG: hypothetical protein DMG41_37135 [Acidobacteriota bacterium]